MTEVELDDNAFHKQDNIFLAAKNPSSKWVAPGSKGRRRWWKKIGLGFKTPKAAILGTYIDHKCPFTSKVSIRGRILRGIIIRHKMFRTVVVRRNYLHYQKKYKRYEKRHKNWSVHISPAFDFSIGDEVVFGQCRPLSKTVTFNVLQVVPKSKKVAAQRKEFEKF
uniref:Small ribosomal subunit protein uS17 n=1 Tax=Euglena gracilis TaxID=3039 RepID=A0A7L5NZS3_EUGGR|nr:40S small subunit ribosomal protein uS17 [Euglena gracilis]6ZJ3_SU Chain SU, Ribosomal protein uS17 [Euglena gracilis]